MQNSPSDGAQAVTEMNTRSSFEQAKDFLFDPERLTQFALGIFAAFIILIFGWLIARSVRKRFRKPGDWLGRINPTLRPVLASGAFYVIMALTLFATLVQLGVPATSLIAVFGAAGLAIGLALKDTLSNVASGIMLLSLRPIDVGEYIGAPSFEGSVTEIGLFATTLTNKDGIAIYVPNAKVWEDRILNYGRLPRRKFSVNIGVAYDTDLRKAVAVGLESLAGHHFVLTDDLAPECYVDSFGDSAINLSFRGWVENKDYTARASELRTALKEALDKAGMDIPLPQRVVTTKNPAASGV